MSLKDLDTEGLSGQLASEYFTGSLIRDTVGLDPEGAPEYIADSITSAISQPVQLHTGFELVKGWNMVGWVYPYSQDVKEAFASILGDYADETDIIIAKDNDGFVYLPEHNFNGIGDFIPGEGYQIKLPDDSPLEGTLTFPIPASDQSDYPNYESLIAARNATTRTLVEGWNMFGYNRSGSKDAIEAFNSATHEGGIGITGSIIIAKNNEGAALLNLDLAGWGNGFFNGIGDLTPGEGYQIKVTETIHGFKFAEDDINEIQPLIDQ